MDARKDFDVPHTNIQISVNNPANGTLIWQPPGDIGERFELVATPDERVQIIAQGFAPIMRKFLLFLPAVSRVDPSIGGLALQELNTSFDRLFDLLHKAEEVEAGRPADA